MWNLLGPDYRHLIASHKRAEINWIDTPLGNSSNSGTDDILSVEYSSQHNQTSAGFRAEVYLEPGGTYQLEVTAKLISGDVAFVYVESGDKRLLPRFKIYQNTVPFKLNHKFITPVGVTQSAVYVGILFFYPDQNYLLEVTEFTIRKISKLTEENLQQLQSNYLASHFSRSVAPSYTFQTSNNPSKAPSTYPLISNGDIQENKYFQQTRNKNPPISKLASIMPDLASDWTIPTIISGLETAVSQYGGNKAFTTASNTAESLISEPSPDLVKILKLPGDEEDEPKAPEGVLPPTVTRSSLETMINVLKEKKIEISISLTTIPSRISKARKVVDSLLKQSLPIKTVFLVVPNRYKRTDKPYLIDKSWYFRMDPRLNIVRAPDVGPMTKLVQILDQVGKNDILLTADDDHIYPRHWAYYLTYLAVNNPDYRAIWGFKGRDNIKGRTVNSIELKGPTNVDWLNGDKGVAYPVKFIRNSSNMLKQVGYNPHAFYCDDLLIGNHMAHYHVSRVVLPAVSSQIQESVYPNKCQWANSRDSLHKMNPPVNIRHPSVINVLKKKKSYYFDYRGYLPKTLNGLMDPEEAEAQNYSNKKDIEEQAGKDENENNSVAQKTDKLIRTKFKKFDASIFANKRVRYISYQTSYLHVDWVLLYIKAIGDATLEMPNLPKNVSLPNDYGRWYGKDPSKFDVIVIDLPFCLETAIQVKRDCPVYYIYRYPEIGDPNCIFSNTSGNQQLIINNYYHSDNLKGKFNIWRLLPDLEVKTVGATWSKDILHLGFIVTDGYYPENIDTIMDFWNANMKDKLNIKLHIGCTPPLSNRLQEITNKYEIRNINIYTSSSIFGAMIYKCDYYLALGYHLDLFAIWAHGHNKKVIGIKYGELKDYNNIITVPYILDTVRVCPDLLHDHTTCPSTGCNLYGSKTSLVKPCIDQRELLNILNTLIEDKEK